MITVFILWILSGNEPSGSERGADSDFAWNESSAGVCTFCDSGNWRDWNLGSDSDRMGACGYCRGDDDENKKFTIVI